MAELPLRNALFSSVTRATPEQELAEFQQNDERSAETKIGDDRPTGNPLVFINERKMREAGASGDFVEKMMQGEALHNLKNVDPDRYKQLKRSALGSPEYMNWARESYLRSMKDGEQRTFEDWHDTSRFDQIIGGYLFAGDKDLPTMANWSRDDLPFGAPLRQELDKLEADLGMKEQAPSSPPFNSQLQRLLP